MKLLTECGYSGLLRGIDTDVTPIFEALDTWMPEYTAGSIGLALQAMVAGEYSRADEILSGLLEGGRTGKDEARAILAMCRALQNDMTSAAQIASDLKGQGGSAEAFATLLASGEDNETQNFDQGSVKMATD